VPEVWTKLAQDGAEVRMRIALMQEDGLAGVHGELELREEGLALGAGGREVAEVVETALADRHRALEREQLAQRLELAPLEAGGMVRMDAGGAVERVRVASRELRGGPRAREVRAGDDLLRDAGGARGGDDLIEVVAKALMREIRADVDPVRRAGRAGCCAIVIHMLRSTRFLALALALAASGAAPLRAQEGGDLQAQILYAYHTEDAHRLSNLVQSLTTRVKSGESDAALHYHLAHADYRLGLLQAQARRAAGGAFSDCIDQLKPILQQDVKSVEALALQGTCYEALAGQRHLEAVLLRSRAEERLSNAEALAPRNPRVALLRARIDLERSRPGTAEHNRALKALERAAHLFEESSATREDVPGWGHAEAYLALGVALAAQGDALGARNWIEKSLIVAPDYRAAQRALDRLVRR